jgi:hypothetical protein
MLSWVAVPCRSRQAITIGANRSIEEGSRDFLRSRAAGGLIFFSKLSRICNQPDTFRDLENPIRNENTAFFAFTEMIPSVKQDRD